MKKHKVVFGIYKNRALAETAADALRQEHFRFSDISLFLPEAHETSSLRHTKSTKAPEGAVMGASAGAIIGGTLGMLASIGVFSISSMELFIAAGPMMSMLAGVGVGGIVGGISGALIGFAMPEYEAKRYGGDLRDGGILLSVHSDDAEWGRRAKNILAHTGAESISMTTEKREPFSGNESSTGLRRETDDEARIRKQDDEDFLWRSNIQ